MLDGSSSRRGLRFALVFGVPGLLFAASASSLGCKDSSPGGPNAAGPNASASAAGSASSSGVAPPVEKRPALTLQGSAIALSPDGKTVYAVDEDHEAIFMASSEMAEANSVRVVVTPGPPAQVVALGDDRLVLVTVRSLPTEDSRAARDTIRGPLPTKENSKITAPSVSRRANRVLRMVPDELEAWVSGKNKLAEAAEETPKKKLPAASASASSKPPSPQSPNTKKPPPKRNTPARPFDPALVRKSQGGLLVGYRPDKDQALVEAFRITLAPDAWGLAVTPDEKRVVVTSAFGSEIAVIDLEAKKTIFISAVAREPRGVAISQDGKTAFVSHLVGTALTKITALDVSPSISAITFPASPPRTPVGWEIGASLAYSLVLSPDEKSLYVPRHALGAEGIGAWWGAPVVDVLDIPTEKHAAPKREAGLPSTGMPRENLRPPADWTASPGQPPSPRNELVQPRAVVYRKKTNTLLVASEGWDTLSELDAKTVDPAMAVLRTYDIAGVYDTFGHFPIRGGAPSAIALSADEDTAFVYCRNTFDIAAVELSTGKTKWLKLAEDGLPADAAHGRSLFTTARSEIIAGGLGCAGCHPEGRDDGYVWREGSLFQFSFGGGMNQRFIGVRANIKMNDGFHPTDEKPDLYPRQTPLIAGRTRAPGPYGWHGESETLLERLQVGTSLHRPGWDAVSGSLGDGENVAKLDALIDYLLSGLLPPPTLVRALSDVEKKGKEVFESKKTMCATCHVPENGFTDRVAYALPAGPTLLGFNKEEDLKFKTPSLWFIAGTAPYFHDGSASTLAELVEKNGNRMGQTSQLSMDEKTALVAYLKTL